MGLSIFVSNFPSNFRQGQTCHCRPRLQPPISAVKALQQPTHRAIGRVLQWYMAWQKNDILNQRIGDFDLHQADSSSIL